MNEEVNHEQAKAGPKLKASQAEVDNLRERVASLETVVAVMAHQSGIPDKTLVENGIKPYELQKKDMNKYAS